MPGTYLFEYAVIRIVPRVEREEFLNAGVILYCKDLNFLQTVFTLDKGRLASLAPGLDIDEIENHLNAFVRISEGDILAGGDIAKLDAPLRFRWLTATRSTVIQTSKVHSGFCTDPVETLNKLQAQLVLLPSN